MLAPIEPPDKTKSGIQLLNTKNGPERGIVVAIGPGKNGISKSEVAVGQTVIFSKYGPDEIEIDGIAHLLADPEDLLAIIEINDKNP